MNHIIIEGFMGCGKGAVAKKIAKAMNLPLIDTDKKVSEKLGMTNGEIYQRFGDVYYRAEETFVLAELLKESARSVIVLGSGLALIPGNSVYLKELGTVYYLELKKKTLAERLGKSDCHAWLGADDLEEAIGRMLRERNPAYKRVADEIIKADDLSVDEIVAFIFEKEGFDPKSAKKAKKSAKKAEESTPAKKSAAKTEKATTKKAGTKKQEAPAKKAAASKNKKKVEDKNMATTKATTKKAAPKKAAAKKPAAKKTAAKPAAKKTATKAAAKKTTAKKAVAKKAPAKKAVAKKAPAKKAVAKKAPAKKTTKKK